MCCPLTVFHVLPPSRGGMRRHVLTLLANLDRDRHRPVLFSMAPLNGDPLKADTPIIVPGKGCGGPIDSVWHLYREIRARKPALIHCHGGRAALAARLAISLPGIEPPPLVYTVHGSSAPNTPWKRWVLAGLERRGASSTAAYITVSKTLARTVTGVWGVPEEKVHVIPNGITIEEFRSLPSRAAARRLFFPDPDRPVVGMIGRLSREKGPDIFLRMASLLARRKPRCRFMVVGDGPQRPALEHLATQMGLAGHVIFTGEVGDVRPALAAMDVVVIPSRLEGQSLAALEAMASGRAVVAAAVGGLAELVKDRKTGLLAPPDDPRDLTDVVASLLEDDLLRRRLAAAGRRYVWQEHEAGAVTRRVEALYDRILQAHVSVVGTAVKMGEG